MTQITNLRISNQNSLEYLKDYVGTGFDVIEKSHLLPADLAAWAQKENMPEDTIDTFIENRLELVIGKLREYLGEIPVRVFDSRQTNGSE